MSQFKKFDIDALRRDLFLQSATSATFATSEDSEDPRLREFNVKYKEFQKIWNSGTADPDEIDRMLSLQTRLSDLHVELEKEGVLPLETESTIRS